jgi:long-chain acyl-CoA synthetase
MPEQHRWSDVVAQTTINGHPSRIYSERPTRITAVLDEARRWGERKYIVQGARTVTFADHAAMVDRIARRLRTEDVRRGDRVGIYAANSAEWVATFFAALSLGAVVVPCNGWWSAEEMSHACHMVEPTVLVCDAKRIDRSPPGRRTIVMETLLAKGPAETPGSAAVVSIDENDPAVILFTAGTTSFPKGAMLSHRSLVSNLQTLLIVSGKLPHQIKDDNPASVALVGLPLFHIGAIQLILVPLMTGSQIIFLDGRFNATEVLWQMEHQQVTMFSGVPTMMERLLVHPDLGKHELTSLRTVVLGGAPVDDALLARIRTAFPSTTRGVGQTYGLTEAGGVVSTGVGSQIAAHPGSSGRLAPVVEARTVHPDQEGNGRVLVRSPAAMDCYWNLPGDTTVDAEGWLDTGDIGRVDQDDYLYITGRAKDVIIRGGENIAAARVEAVLSSHPAVAEVAVVGLPNSDLGEVVGAVVVLSGDRRVSVDELSAYAGERLAHFAVPQHWWIHEDPLPTNDAGKVAKVELVAAWRVGDNEVPA